LLPALALFVALKWMVAWVRRKYDELQNELRDAEKKREIPNLDTPQQLFEKLNTRIT
jgi:hypothetical protein